MIPTLWQLILVGCGGAVGAMLRLCANQLTVYLWGERFPWGTLIVNLIGCFLLGFVIRLGALTSPRISAWPLAWDCWAA